jgi:hypothetical protein
LTLSGGKLESQEASGPQAAFLGVSPRLAPPTTLQPGPSEQRREPQLERRLCLRRPPGLGGACQCRGCRRTRDDGGTGRLRGVRSARSTPTEPTYFFRTAALTMEQPKTAHDPPSRVLVAGSHHSKRLVYGGLGLGLTLSEKAEGLVGSEWLLVGIGATKELGVSV